VIPPQRSRSHLARSKRIRQGRPTSTGLAHDPRNAMASTNGALSRGAKVLIAGKAFVARQATVSLQPSPTRCPILSPFAASPSRQLLPVPHVQVERYWTYPIRCRARKSEWQRPQCDTLSRLLPDRFDQDEAERLKRAVGGGGCVSMNVVIVSNSLILILMLSILEPRKVWTNVESSYRV